MIPQKQHSCKQTCTFNPEAIWIKHLLKVPLQDLTLYKMTFMGFDETIALVFVNK